MMGMGLCGMEWDAGVGTGWSKGCGGIGWNRCWDGME